MSRSAIVVGGSMAGLFAASLLRKSGWQVRLFERASEGLASRGAGIGTHDELFEAMRRAGAAVDQMIGIEVEGRAAYGDDGAEIARFAFPQYLTSWALLYRRMRATLDDRDYRLGMNVVDVVDGDDGAEVTLADGSRHSADLVVGADGSWSTVRECCNPDEQPAYCGYVAWRGLVEETRLPTAFRERYGRFLNFYMRPDQQLILYPVAGVDDGVGYGERRFSFLWYRPYSADEGLARLLTDESGVRHRYQISPLKIAQAEIDRLHREAAAWLPPDFAAYLQAVERPFVQPIYDFSPSRIGFRHVALIGDAACIARPHVGAGVAKAATDAAALVDALTVTDTVIAGLARYQAERQPFGCELVDKGRHLGAYLEWPADHPAHVPILSTEEIIRESAMLAARQQEPS